LVEQFTEIAIRLVNEPWFKAVGLPRAASELACKGFIEGWDRDSYDGKVIRVVYEMVSNCSLRTDTPGLEFAL
jgi:hypothetical protein